MLHLAEMIAISQARRVPVDTLYAEVHARLEAESVAVPGTVWEARIDWADGTPDFVGGMGYILAAPSFGRLLAALHARGFLTGEHDPHERLGSIARRPAA